MRTADADSLRWRAVAETLNRPYPVTLPMVVLLLLVPFYFFIGELTPGRTLHVPELAQDKALGLQPAWALVYGSLYLFAIMPFIVIRQEALIRRTALASLTVWIAGYIVFLAYPTIAPRPDKVIGQSFFAWGLQVIYSADTRYNCFPSLHVAQSFVSALACWRVHRGVGVAAGVWASLIAISTVYTKQHYILDVVAGIFLAYAAYAVFLRTWPREAVPEDDHRVAPAIALGLLGIQGLVVAGFWIAYELGA